MSFLFQAFDAFLHLDRYLGVLIQSLGSWSYVLLMLVIFAETGLVVTPFLPGDSLLFAIGAFAARGDLSLWIVLPTLIAAAIIGDSVNYTIGRRFGQWFITKTNGRLIKQEHLEKTERFYAKYGAKTIVLARFVPIVRTLAPFVAGVGKMEYKKFLFFNVFGGILWVVLFVVAGYLFGNIPVVQDNFTFVIFGIIGVSLVPGIIEYARAKWGKEKAPPVISSE